MICLSYLARASICFPFTEQIAPFLCHIQIIPPQGWYAKKYDRRSIMHNEQQRQPAQQPDARTQQVLGRVRHIINKKNTQFILDHQHDSLAALSLYLRDCMEDIGHPPARVEVIGGDFLEYRFGSWQKALRSVYDGKAAEFLKNPPSFANRKIVRDLCAAAGVQL